MERPLEVLHDPGSNALRLLEERAVVHAGQHECPDHNPTFDFVAESDGAILRYQIRQRMERRFLLVVVYDFTATYSGSGNGAALTTRKALRYRIGCHRNVTDWTLLLPGQ